MVRIQSIERGDLIVRLGQPFRALLLAQQYGDYNRVRPRYHWASQRHGFCSQHDGRQDTRDTVEGNGGVCACGDFDCTLHCIVYICTPLYLVRVAHNKILLGASGPSNRGAFGVTDVVTIKSKSVTISFHWEMNVWPSVLSNGSAGAGEAGLHKW